MKVDVRVNCGVYPVVLKLGEDVDETWCSPHTADVSDLDGFRSGDRRPALRTYPDRDFRPSGYHRAALIDCEAMLFADIGKSSPRRSIP